MNSLRRLQQLAIVGIHFLKGGWQLLIGLWRVLKIPAPRVSIFGGSRIGPESVYAKMAHEFAYLLAQEGVSVLTGGGPGIMEAANCGVVHKNGNLVGSGGISVRGMKHEQAINPCAQVRVEVDYFWARKWLLIDYSAAFVVFPGGFGTVDELMELLTLIQTGKLAQAPIVLIGVSYWSSLIAWAEVALKEKLIEREHIKLFAVTDNLDEAMSLVKAHCKEMS